MIRRLFPILPLLALAASAFAADLTGTVTDKTTGKPAAGATVILLKMEGGMDEAGRTKTDGRGHYAVKLDNDAAPHLVRVVYQDVTYHKQAPPGSSTADVEVYDAAPKVDNVSTTIHFYRFEPQNGQMNVVEGYAINNGSTPPKTQMSEKSFEFSLPPEATIDSADAVTKGGMPITASPIPDAKTKGKYAFMFPLRPGETQFRILYHLPYSGSMEWKPAIDGTTQHLVIEYPNTVTVDFPSTPQFEAMADQGNAKVRVATNIDPKANVSFKISGTGAIQEEQAQGGDQQGGQPAAGGQEGPGGGLGKPIQSENPLQKYMWWILGGFVVLLAGGAFLFYKQPIADEEEEVPAAMKKTRVVAAAARPATVRATAPGNGRSGNMMLDALKEELFALETDRAAGKISDAEYKKHKEALDVTLQRALSRQK
jgi:5-hydroxyisourate hydrolase-like protein (transthyretin family)